MQELRVGKLSAANSANQRINWPKCRSEPCKSDHVKKSVGNHLNKLLPGTGSCRLRIPLKKMSVADRLQLMSAPKFPWRPYRRGVQAPAFTGRVFLFWASDKREGLKSFCCQSDYHKRSGAKLNPASLSFGRISFRISVDFSLSSCIKTISPLRMELVA